MSGPLTGPSEAMGEIDAMDGSSGAQAASLRELEPAGAPSASAPRPWSATLWLTAALCLAFAGLHLAARAWSAPEATWGFRMWARFPAWVGAAWTGAILLAALPPVNRAACRALEHAHRLSTRIGQRTGRRRELLYLLVTLAVSIAATCASIELFSRIRYGDGPLGMQDSNHAPLSAALFHALVRITAGHGMAPRDLVRLTSSVCGGLFVFILFRFVRLFPAGGATRPLVFLLVLGVGSVQIFFSYLEVYFIPATMLLITLYYSLRYLRRSSSIRAPSIAFVIGYVSHLSLAWYAPAMLALWAVELHRVWRSRRWWTPPIDLAAVALTAVVTVSIAFGTLWQLKYHGDWTAFTRAYPQAGFEILRGHVPNSALGLGFVPIEGHWNPRHRYTFGSIPHRIDVVNEQLLAAGVLLPALLLFALLRGRPRDALNPKLAVPGLFALMGVVYAVCWYPAWGQPRYWDLYSVGAFPVAVLMAVAVTARARDRLERDALLLLVVTDLAHTVPWVSMNHLG